MKPWNSDLTKAVLKVGNYWSRL